MAQSQEQPIQKKYCNSCGWTNHLLRHEEQTSWTDEIDSEFEISGGDRFQLMRCLGCDSVCLVHHSWFSEDCDGQGRPIQREKRYPPALKRRHQEWFNVLVLPSEIHSLLGQIYNALQNESYALCALRIRALLERLMIDKVGEQGSLGKNINAFIQQGYIATARAGDYKEKVIEAGNAAMHRGYAPTAPDVEALLDVTEGLIATIYVHPKKLADMSKRVPKRSK